MLAMNNSAATVYDYLKSHWTELETRYGEGFTSETDLARTLGVDRFAARRALRRLVSEGRIFHVRQQGYRFRQKHFEVNLTAQTSYSRFCSTENVHPKVEIVSICHEHPRPEIAKILHLAPDEIVWHIHFHRFTGDVPFCLTHSWIPHSRTKGLLGHLRTQTSLYKTLATHYHIHPRRSESRIQAVSADRDEAKLLDTALAYPLLQVNSLALCQNAIPIEYCETKYRSDLVSLSLDFEPGFHGEVNTTLKGSAHDPTTAY
jgi:GntR family transcriptional regulator